jgi:hypothetical protein
MQLATVQPPGGLRDELIPQVREVAGEKAPKGESLSGG